MKFISLNDDSKEIHYIPTTNLESEKWYERDDMFSQ